MLSENEPTLFGGLIYYRNEIKDFLIESIKSVKKRIKNLK